MKDIVKALRVNLQEGVPPNRPLSGWWSRSVAVLQERISKRTEKQTVGMSVSHVAKVASGQTKRIHPERISERAFVPQEGIPQCTWCKKAK